jgi:hypothetical protein
MVVIWRGLGGGLGVKRRVGKERKGSAKSLTIFSLGSTLLASPPNGYWQNGYCSMSGGRPERGRGAGVVKVEELWLFKID